MEENEMRREFYAAFDREYGCKVAAGGKVSRKQFCDLMVEEVGWADCVVPVDFNDVRTVFKRVQIADAAVATCAIADFGATMREVIGDFRRRHGQARIRNMVIMISFNEGEELTWAKTQELRYEVDDEIRKDDERAGLVCGFARDNSLEIGRVRVVVGVGMYRDVREESVRVDISRKLAYLLRHTDAVDSRGFCPIADAMDYCGVMEEELRYVVEHDDKNRFEFIDDSSIGSCVRARNGHSADVDVDLGLPAEVPPATLYHATTEKALEAIIVNGEGLKGMSRKYVQLTESPETALEAAKRHKGSAPVLLEIEALVACRCGVRFCRTTNGVWQVEHLPCQYLRVVRGATEE